MSGGGEREWPLQGPGRPHTIVGVIISPAAGPPSASGRPSVSHMYFILFTGTKDGVKATQHIALRLWDGTLSLCGKLFV